MVDLINKKITVQIKKVSFCKDGHWRVTIFCPGSKACPSLVFTQENFEKFKKREGVHNEK